MSTQTLDLGPQAASFRRTLEALKKRINPVDFQWYPYDSLANLGPLEDLLAASNQSLPELAAGEPVLDLGCADGDFAFFLESLGFTVHAVDYPPTSHNLMRGAKALKAALHSCVEIHEIDLDEQFRLPREHYSAAFMLGLLYHLKNPFYALEALSKHATYCFLSTRIASLLPDRRTAIRDAPVAYLVDNEELNGDWSNYWVLSEAGLRRLLKRANWDVLGYVATGETQSSDPVRLDHDERAFCLLKSNFGLANVELLEGWHPAEKQGWRWTMKAFSVACRIPRAPARLRLQLFVPPALLENFDSITLHGAANDVPLGAETFAKSGLFTYTRTLRVADAVRLRFWLDHALEPGRSDQRELGIIVSAIQIE